MQYAKSCVLWPEFEPKVLAFAKSELSQMPPSQWKFALQTFYNGLKQAANPVRQKVQPLRGGMPAGGAAAPQSSAPAQPVPPVIPAPASEPKTQPAPQGEPVVTAQEPEAPAQPEPEQEAPEQPQPAEPRCPHCGAAVKTPGAVFCTSCGRRLDE